MHYDCVINPLLTRNNNQTIIIVVLIDRSYTIRIREKTDFNLFNENEIRQKSIEKWRIRQIKRVESSSQDFEEFIRVIVPSDHEILFINSIRSSSIVCEIIRDLSTIFELTTCINCYFHKIWRNKRNNFPRAGVHHPFLLFSIVSIIYTLYKAFQNHGWIEQRMMGDNARNIFV